MLVDIEDGSKLDHMWYQLALQVRCVQVYHSSRHPKTIRTSTWPKQYHWPHLYAVSLEQGQKEEELSQQHYLETVQQVWSVAKHYYLQETVIYKRKASLLMKLDSYDKTNVTCTLLTVYKSRDQRYGKQITSTLHTNPSKGNIATVFKKFQSPCKRCM